MPPRTALPQSHRFWQARTPVERYDLSRMDHLLENHHVVGTLHDLEVIEVAADSLANNRRTGVHATNASRIDWPILWANTRAIAPRDGSQSSLLPFRSQCRYAAVWGIHDLRGTQTRRRYF